MAATITLPATSYLVASVPPLSAAVTAGETLIPGELETRQSVVVRVNGSGRPVSAFVRDRLLLRGTGDYSFSIGGPFTDVRPGPDTQSQPGFQTDSILWRGFAVRRRVLDAVASLRVADSAPSLPLRVTLKTDRRGITLTLTNVTSVVLKPFAGTADPARAAAALDRIRVALASSRDLLSESLEVRGTPRPRTIPAVAPLLVDGELSAGARRIAFRRTLGDGGPLTLRVYLDAHGALKGVSKLRLTARPVLPRRLLEPPGAATWAALAHRRTLDGAKLVDVALASLLGAARARQYEEFVATPGSVARRETVYSFRTQPHPVAIPRSAPPSRGARSPLRAIAIIAGALLALGAAVVAWAHL